MEIGWTKINLYKIFYERYLNELNKKKVIIQKHLIDPYFSGNFFCFFY